MGRRGSWFSAIKRVFTHSSKEKPTDGSDKKSRKEKKGKGVLKHGETKSFIPRFREPSSIEKILGEADQLLIRPPPSSEQLKSPPSLVGRQTSPRVASPKASSRRVSSPKAASPKASSPKAASLSLPLPKPAPQKASTYGAAPPKASPSGTAPLKASTSGAAPPKASTSGVAPPKASTSGAAPPKPSTSVAAPSKPSTSMTAPPKASTSVAAPSKPSTSMTAPPKALTPVTAPPKASTPVTAPPKASTPVTAPPKASTSVAAPPKASTSSLVPPKASTSGAAPSKAAAPKAKQSGKEIIYVQKPEPTLTSQHVSATKIQAAYRGFMARRSFRALKGLARLQGVVKGQNVKRQMVSAMKQMQLLVRVQTQIQSRRIHMMENNAQAHRNDKEVESTLSKMTLNQLFEASQNEDWDASLLTKEEVEDRLRKKVEAVIKRERAMSYAYTHQTWKANPKSAQSHPDIGLNGFPWWWNWLERQLPPAGTSTRNIGLTPSRTTSQYNPSPRSNYRLSNFAFDNHESSTPRSSRSAIPIRAKYFQTPPANTSSLSKYSKPRISAASSVYDKDDHDSLVSCPPFSVPNYMTPTASAKAKVRANSNPGERFLRTPDSNRRFSFPLTPNSGSIKWSKGSNLGEKEDESRSIGEFSTGSAVSMPALVGRKPFNRFV